LQELGGLEGGRVEWRTGLALGSGERQLHRLAGRWERPVVPFDRWGEPGDRRGWGQPLHRRCKSGPVRTVLLCWL